jgi:hypothetical protein
MPWHNIATAWKGIGNYPLRQDQKGFLRDELLNGNHGNLWSISNALIIVYRWPNNELRFWLTTPTGHMCEGDNAARFYKYFPCIESSSEGYLFHLDAAKHVQISQQLMWMPQNSNYSHFLCDYFAPVIAAQVTAASLLKSSKILAVQNWDQWQLELIAHLGLKAITLQALRAGEILAVQADEVILPVIENPINSQNILRGWLSRVFFQDSIYNAKTYYPAVYIRRTGDRASRIKNTKEIEDLVESFGGVSIDATALTIKQKYDFFRSCGIIIGDGSSSMNAVLFMRDHAHFIGLTDPLILGNDDFLIGGWPYLHMIAHQSSFVIGQDHQPLAGSPLASASYPASVISQLIINQQLNSI